MPNTITTAFFSFFFFFCQKQFQSPELFYYSISVFPLKSCSPQKRIPSQPAQVLSCHNCTSHIISLRIRVCIIKIAHLSQYFSSSSSTCSHLTLPSHANESVHYLPINCWGQWNVSVSRTYPGSVPAESSQAQPLINAIVRTEEEPLTLNCL